MASIYNYIFGFKSVPKICSMKPMIYGHRGCITEGITENTLNSLQYAYKKGIKGVEVDVQLTKDGEVVLFHDENLERLFEVKGKSIQKMTLAELLKLKYVPDSSRIVLLKDALQYCKERDMKILVEIKGCGGMEVLCRKTIDLLKQCEMKDDSVIIAFSPLVLRNVWKMNENIATCFLYTGKGVTEFLEGTFPSFCKSKFYPNSVIKIFDSILEETVLYFVPSVLGTKILGPDVKILNEEKIKSLQNRGFSIYAWVVNDTNLMRYLLERDVAVACDKIMI